MVFLILLLPSLVGAQLLSNDVLQIIAQAVHVATSKSPHSVIAVTDREGFVLGVWSVDTNAPPEGQAEIAIAKAGTAAFLSSDQHAFSTRTAGFIIMQHFPPLAPIQTNLPPFEPLFDSNICAAISSIFPSCRFPIPKGVRNRPPGPLVGVEFSNLPHSDVNFFKRIGDVPTTLAGTNGIPILNPRSPTALDGTPGGVPLYKNGSLVGGIGVAHTNLFSFKNFNFATAEPDEEIALAGQLGYAPGKKIYGSRVFVDGIRLAYIHSLIAKIDTNIVFFSASTPGNVVSPYFITNTPTVIYPMAAIGGVTGEVRYPIIADTNSGSINGAPRLTAMEVTNIIAEAAHRSQMTRARIRLPRNVAAQVFISVVNNPGTNGGPPQILGSFRTPDATIFSWDVSVQKARTAVYFSQTNHTAIFFGSNNFNIAMSARTVGFLAQSLFPPGIDGTGPGPLHLFQESISSTATSSAPNPELPNGVTIFPGGFPLYRNGELIGAIGVSGDGVDEDDIIAASGAASFPPPNNIRADQFSFEDARLPYAKFPRNPNLGH